MPSVLVTGAARGIGATIVAQLADTGWDVLAGVRSDTDAAAIGAVHPRITPVLLDITDDEHLAALPDVLPSRLDAVVNNAGIVVAGPVETGSADDWRRQLEINVIGQLAGRQNRRCRRVTNGFMPSIWSG